MSSDALPSSLLTRCRSLGLALGVAATSPSLRRLALAQANQSFVSEY